MHLSENEGIEGNRFVVTGGLGFVGAALCLELVRRGAEEVRSFDTRYSSPWSLDLQKNGVRCIRGDVSQRMNLKEALKGANCVFHLASYGMSGKEMLQASRIDEVNINGTCNVLDVCHEVGIKRLVYVSTYNVVFGGKEIVNGNESLPYYSIDDHVDPYGRSKSIAEQLVLKSNGRPSKKRSGIRLYTCAIRPAAIYGPGEERHFPRILFLAQMGLAFFKVGDSSVKTDWVYVDNLVLALILASMGLLDDIPGRKGHPIAAGQAYFISDGSPVNTFNSIINPVFKRLDYDVPKITISVKHALLMSRICWFICMFLYPWLNRPWVPGPLILPAEVYKIGVTHYFSYMKAKEELGYTPMTSPCEGLAKTISYWKDRKQRDVPRPNIFIWISVIVGMSSLFYTAFLPTFWPLKWLNSLALFIFRSVSNLRLLFYIAVLLHVGEAIYVWFRARRVDSANATGWFWQTFILGFSSTKLFLRRASQA
ncbi:short-chain dehydrogenase/reductase family 42E member 1 [Phalaenopsis equestris]|uniref:short-chain dehydrogenase/reductase family 42E member 1 n=1 Tax=Phalaenopsis equestris TaxID=78828 RepID=UPI0009E51CC4|nr:short-chain dehydrogenase/reductase family 42E member 1 [Phalaenopsis equestris]XP_020583967.1 short-chain dehydrogenase/reductase family 42E member 1 [Phalaenopsis equestris]XP_020583975.1 short-chain dehydrogenase/reductase family 42E member 1 [Phalaenopsis equestris]XP_020583983.1 short-chain dehydrogenase/reductase family 42E member 1 [Phalaenopsis equestris]